jgi:hypothetical protein
MKVLKQTPKSPTDPLFEDLIALPEESKRFIQEGMSPEIKITITPKSFVKAQEISDLLHIMRGVEKPERIGETHPHVILINTMEGNSRPLSEVMNEVRFYHQAWSDLAASDAAKLALTQMTKLNMNIEPLPYEPVELEVEFENDWEKPRAQIPPTARNMSNIYERRLKLFNDMVDAGGLFFRIEVINRINASFAKLMGEQGRGQTDFANFRS